jgi:5'-deoxynucleotidase YfbR-like HD superfamily hydrolase
MQQIVDFILELDKLKGVLRKVRPLALDRYENSAEHSWQLALLAISLARYAEEPLDINRVIRMLLVHDVGEIDAGDVMFFAHVNWEERKAAERAAVTRIFSILPEEDSSDLLQLWHEFEEGESAEARFAHAVDRAMPVLLNLVNQGQSWRENGICYERVVNRIAPPIQTGCPALWTYLQPHLEEARQKGFFGA